MMRTLSTLLFFASLGLVSGCSDKATDSTDSGSVIDTVDSGSANPMDCQAGERVENHACVPCEAGTVNASGDSTEGEDTTCDPCEAGSYAASGDLCEPCEPGFISEDQAESCSPCPAGSVEVENDCMDCPEDFTSEEGDVECFLEGASGHLDIRDYGYLFWPGNHWVNWGSFYDVQHVQTGFYGAAFDVSNGSFDTLGIIADEIGPEEALTQSNTVVTDLPAASIQYALIKSGNEHRGAQQFLGYDGSSTNPSGLIDMGRYMQRVEIPQVT